MLKAAITAKCPYIIISCSCNDSLAKERIEQRNILGEDPSEANYQIRNKQKSWLEVLDNEEVKYSISVNENTLMSDIVDKIKLLQKMQIENFNSF